LSGMGGADFPSLFYAHSLNRLASAEFKEKEFSPGRDGLLTFNMRKGYLWKGLEIGLF